MARDGLTARIWRSSIQLLQALVKGGPTDGDCVPRSRASPMTRQRAGHTAALGRASTPCQSGLPPHASPRAGHGGVGARGGTGITARRSPRRRGRGETCESRDAAGQAIHLDVARPAGCNAKLEVTAPERAPRTLRSCRWRQRAPRARFRHHHGACRAAAHRMPGMAADSVLVAAARGATAARRTPGPRSSRPQEGRDRAPRASQAAPRRG